MSAEIATSSLDALPASAPSRPGLRKRQWLLAALLPLLGLALWAADRIAVRHYLSAGQARAEAALRLTANGLEADLARYEVVPQLLAEMDLVRRLVSQPDDTELRQATSEWLATENASLRAADIYLIRPDGETIAASNHLDGPNSFVGRNFSYRPYFTEAMQGGAGRFYGIGTASGIRGYFFSAPVFDFAGRIAGVIAVKVGLDRIEQSWRGDDFRTFVTDPEGRVFLSSEPRWLYASFEAPTPQRVDRTLATRRYADAPLPDLPVERRADHGSVVLRITTDGEARDYIAAAQQMPRAGWTVHVLLDSAAMRAEARLAVFTVMLLLGAGALGALILLQRRARAAERIALQQQANAELERRVQERTAELALLNRQLGQEVAERRATEAELRAAQDSLVQVGKLAALGQMSASLSHEINQPLAAARNYADSAAILIERGDHAEARENIQAILALVDRMAAKSSAGYDLTALMVGSEGTLGIITELTLRLHGQPEDVAAAVCAFPSLTEAVTCVAQTMQLGIPMARIEFMDPMAMRAINLDMGSAYPEEPHLMIEFNGSPDAVRANAEAFGEIAAEHGGKGFQWASTLEERNRLWAARHNSYWATLKLRPGATGVVTDICVPMSELPGAVAAAAADMEAAGLLGDIVGHVGDGNFHTLMLVEPGNTDEIATAKRIARRMADRAIAVGGTISGEHGIGVGKRDLMLDQHGEACAVMSAIKRALDPNNIMNPGKLLPDFN